MFPVILGALASLSNLSGSSDEVVSLPEDSVYLGQRYPGRSPEIFAPGIISETEFRLHGPVVFSPDLGEICWAVIPPAILSVSCEENGWTDPAALDLPGRVVQAPAFSPDGQYLFFQAVGEESQEGVFIWKALRTEDGWGNVSSTGSVINSGRLQSQPCLTADGTMYYTGYLEGVCFDRGIYRSRLIDGEYQEPELQNEAVNSEFIDYCPWVAPDESYLLFASSRPRTEEPLYLQISFRSEDGSWSRPVNIHEAIGFEDPARFPSVSPDGRFLFFISGNRAYWVEMAPVLELRSKKGLTETE